MALNPATPCQGDLGARPSIRRSHSFGVRAGFKRGSQAGSLSFRYRVPDGVGCKPRSGRSPEIAYQQCGRIRSSHGGVCGDMDQIVQSPLRNASNELLGPMGRTRQGGIDDTAIDVKHAPWSDSVASQPGTTSPLRLLELATSWKSTCRPDPGWSAAPGPLHACETQKSGQRAVRRQPAIPLTRARYPAPSARRRHAADGPFRPHRRSPPTSSHRWECRA